MTSVETTEEITSTGKPRSAGRIVFGLLLLLPAFLCCITELLVPTIRTFWLSFQDFDFFREEGTFAGLENYTFLFGDSAFGQTISFSLLSLVIRLVVVTVMPPLLAWAVGKFGRSVRLGLRVVLTIPLVLFVPVGIGITWLMALHPVTGLISSGIFSLSDPGKARITLLFIDGLYTFGLACGLSLIFYLPIWRRPAEAPPPTFRETLRPLLATWGTGILATIVFSFSTFTLNFAMTSGGPANSTLTFGVWLYRLAFQILRFGPAAALASILLLISIVLGIVAGLLILLTRIRLNTADIFQTSEQADDQPEPQQNKTLSTILLVLLLIPALGACLFSVLPFGWLLTQPSGEVGLGELFGKISLGRILVSTFIPPLLTAIIQVLIAYPAAISLGALQPFGKRSDWLLLAFSPWLFVTILPLSLVSILSARTIGTINTFMGLLSPILFSVPILFVLTLFFKGQAAQWQKASTDNEASKSSIFFKHLILPSLPLVGILLLFSLFIGWQDVFWSLSISSNPEYRALGAILLQALGVFGPQGGTLVSAVTKLILPISFLFFVVFALFQFFYLDRLVFYSDEP